VQQRKRTGKIGISLAFEFCCNAGPADGLAVSAVVESVRAKSELSVFLQGYLPFRRPPNPDRAELAENSAAHCTARLLKN
jgi:hypothetical protein